MTVSDPERVLAAPVPPGKQLTGMGLLRRYLRGRGRPIRLLVVLIAASTALQVAAPLVLGSFVDAVAAGKPDTLLVQYGLTFLLLAVAAQVCWVVGDLVGSRLAWSATNELRADLLDHFLHLDGTFFEAHSPGELVERLDGDAGRLSTYFSRMFLLVAVNAFLLIGIAVGLVLIAPLIAGGYLTLAVGSATLLRRLVRDAVPHIEAQRRAEANQVGYMEEHLAGLEDIRPNGASAHVERGFWWHATRVLNAGQRAATAGVRWPAAAELLAGVALIAALASVVVLSASGRLSIGDAFAVMAYIGMLRIPMFVVTMQFRELQDAVAATRRISELFCESSSVADGPREVRPESAGALTVADLAFAYDPDRPVLRSVSFHLAPGERLALVGPSGSGKSTLMKLLFRFSDPVAGSIELDGEDIRSFSLRGLRSRVALVTQDVQIFDATVFDNVTLFDNGISEESVVNSLAAVGLSAWLERHRDGIRTHVGQRGAGLSAGEAQLLAFARALVRDPLIVLLDEPSSRLDPVTQRALEAATRALLRGRTSVIVAHRLETVRTADQVLVLSHGKVMEQGRYAQLTAVDSVFRRMIAEGEAVS